MAFFLLFSDHIFAIPILYYPTGKQLLTLTIGKYNGNETHDYTFPTLQYTPQMSIHLGLLDNRYKLP